MNVMMAKSDTDAPALRDPRWQAVVARDASSDGTFVYGVTSTKVYCRPSCPARHAKPKNVHFYATCAEAEQAGYRPCKRCKPNEAGLVERNAAKVARICRLIEAGEQVPALADLAAQAGMSPYHLHRVFKAVTGLTPSAYAREYRARRVRDELALAKTSVTAAIYGAGFNSNGRFYATADEVLGMMPSKYRAGGENTAIRFAIDECSLGLILVAQSERGVCAIFLGDDRDDLTNQLRSRFPNAKLIGDDADFEALVAKVVAFVEAPQLGLDLPLDIRGTAFQQRVWRALMAIPPGETVSYSAIAKKIGAPKAVRAVARACATNAIAVAVPCHRAVCSDGALSGYRWGVERKRALLKKEESGQ